MILGWVLGLAIGCGPDPDATTRTATESWSDGSDKLVEVTGRTRWSSGSNTTKMGN